MPGPRSIEPTSPVLQVGLDASAADFVGVLTNLFKDIAVAVEENEQLIKVGTLPHPAEGLMTRPPPSVVSKQPSVSSAGSSSPEASPRLPHVVDTPAPVCLIICYGLPKIPVSFHCRCVPLPAALPCFSGLFTSLGSCMLFFPLSTSAFLPLLHVPWHQLLRPFCPNRSHLGRTVSSWPSNSCRENATLRAPRS